MYAIAKPPVRRHNHQCIVTMKAKHIIACLTCAATLGLLVPALAGEEKEKTVSMDQVPQKVKDTLVQYAALTDVKQVELGEDDDQKVYEFDIEQGTHKFEVSITPKGKYWGTEEDMELNAMPEPVQKALKDRAAGGKITEGEKAVDKDQHVTYEAEVEKDGKKFEVTVSPEGKILDEEDITKEKD